MVQESRGKESKEAHRYKVDRPKVNMIDYDSDCSDDESNVYTAEFVWPSKAKPFTCQELKPIHNNPDDDMELPLILLSAKKILMCYCKQSTLKYLILYHRLRS